uniref:Uncharacterized protein n=1 Tax=Glossina palpalis gambiensis TaxID=67801 RepID=A0A1B0AWH0_9MUSC
MNIDLDLNNDLFIINNSLCIMHSFSLRKAAATDGGWMEASRMIENSYTLLIIINAEMANFSYALHSHHRHQYHHHHHHHHHYHHCFNVKVQNIPLKCVKHFKNSENISATLKLSTRAMTLRSELTIRKLYIYRI